MSVNNMSVILLVSFLAVMFSPSRSYPQVDEAMNPPIQNSLVEGAWAIQFQIDDYFTLRSFQGSIISLKRHLSDNSAIRLGVTGTFNTGDNSEDEETIFTDTSEYVVSSSSNSNQRGVTVNLQYIIYPNPESDINLFFGSGPMVQYSYNLEERTNLTPSREYTSKSEYHTWYLGLIGIAGVEWFATKSISLHAEYNATLQHVWTSRNNESFESGTTSGSRRTSSESDGTYWRLIASSVKFGLSAYF